MLAELGILLSNFIFVFLKVLKNNAFPPPLPPEREKELFVLCKQGDENARKLLIEHNLRLVAHIIKKYYTTYKEQDELISIGTIGLIKAIDTYNIDNGTKFTTYAGKCLQNEILMYFRSQKKISCETSINEAIEYDKDGNPLTYMDIMSIDDTIVDTIDIKDKSILALKGIKDTLTDREREIIILRYGLNRKKPITQREVAIKLGISRSYVSRIEKSAIEKIRKYMNKQNNFI